MELKDTCSYFGGGMPYQPRNPLHGVESEGEVGRGQAQELRGNPLHGVESLSGSWALRRLESNPLHGVESG